MKTRRILLIEDDDTIAYGLTELLADEGFETISVRFLKEAMEAVPGISLRGFARFGQREKAVRRRDLCRR